MRGGEAPSRVAPVDEPAAGNSRVAAPGLCGGAVYRAATGPLAPPGLLVPHTTTGPASARPSREEIAVSTTTSERVRNGVDTQQLFGTLDLVKEQPELAQFQFRATNRWIGGAHNRTTIRSSTGPARLTPRAPSPS